jgi:hypothetical protein
MKVPGWLALVTLLLSACGEEDRTPLEFTPSLDRAATAADDAAPLLLRVTSPADTMPHPPGPPRTSTIVLTGAGPSLAGEVVITSRSASSSLTARLTGGDAGVTYSGEVRQGTCVKPGGRVVTLNPVSADSAGVGSSYSDVSVGIAQLTGIPHLIAFRAPQSGAVCGPIAVQVPG